jgi:hypothetical protein
VRPTRQRDGHVTAAAADIEAMGRRLDAHAVEQILGGR